MGYPYPHLCLCAFLGPYISCGVFKAKGLHKQNAWISGPPTTRLVPWIQKIRRLNNKIVFSTAFVIVLNTIILIIVVIVSVGTSST